MSPSSQTSANNGKSTSAPKVKTSPAVKCQRPPARHLHISPEYYFKLKCERIAKKASIQQLQPIPEASEDGVRLGNPNPPHNWHAKYFEEEEAYEASKAGKARKKEENEDKAKCAAILKSNYTLVNGRGGSRKCKKP